MSTNEDMDKIREGIKRKRDYQDDFDEQRAKDILDKIHEQRETTLKKHREKMNAAETYQSYGSHGLDFSGHNQHGVNEVSEKMHSSELDISKLSIHNDRYVEKSSDKPPHRAVSPEQPIANDEYMHQMAQHHIERREMEHQSSQNTTVNRKTENVSDLYEIKAHFQYTNQFFYRTGQTAKQVFTNAGKTVYNTMSQDGDYSAIHNFEQMRRGTIATIASMRVMSDLAHQTAARIAVVGSYVKNTAGHISRYIKGTNPEKVLTELEKIRNFTGPLSVWQKQHYEFLEKELSELQKGYALHIAPTTVKQLRSEMHRVFTISQYNDLFRKYGSMAELSLPQIEKQIASLCRKQTFGEISDFQKRRLTQLGELKEIHRAALRENGHLLKLSSSRIYKEIGRLQKLKNNVGLTAPQTIWLEKLTELRSLHKLKRKINKNIRARRNLNIAFTRLVHQTLSKSDDSGIHGLSMATELCTNRYTKAIVREIAKLNKFVAQNIAQGAALGVKKISDKTGLSKQVNVLKTRIVKNLANKKPVVSVHKLKGKLNGEIYSKFRKQISSKTAKGLKTAAKKTKSTTKAAQKASSKISKVAKRSSKTLSKFFSELGEMITNVKKISFLVVVVVLLIFIIILAVVSVISSASSSVILEDISYLNEYIEVLNENQNNFKEKLALLGDGYKNVTYSYTDGSKMNNTREILCMAAVYFQQDFSDKNKIKAYLTQMFNASHFYATEESETYYCSDGIECDNKKIETLRKSDGSEEIVYVCLGHKDLSVTITALAFDEIFSASLNTTGVGDLCFAFETGGQTLGNYNCWYCEDIGDGTGMNYGMMSTNRSQARSMWNYIKANSENFARKFEGTDGFTGDNLNPFGALFNNIWRDVHSPEETAEMEQLQRAWAWNSYGTTWCADFQSRTGVDMTRSWALSEVALSRAVHRGAYSASVFSGCVNSSMTDEQIIDAIYDYEYSHLPSFKSRWDLERNYAKSFLGREFPSDNSEQFSWTDDNIEWCKNLYEQNWEELYEGLVGLNSATVGSNMSDAEVEALIGSLDGLSEERKHLLSWACSAVGVIPYHWDWRSYWTIDTDDWGSITTPDYKGRKLKGLDCSGFVIWCYNKAGYDPVTCGWGAKGYTGTIADSMKTIQITHADLKPGDIGMSGSWPYTHTGIYAGNGKWIHCTGAPTNNTVLNSYSGFTTFYRLTDLD